MRACMLPCPGRVMPELPIALVALAQLEGRDITEPCSYKSKSIEVLNRHRQKHTDKGSQFVRCINSDHQHDMRGGSGGMWDIDPKKETK